jgi:UDP-2-acetamido-3-amino-2,3-dideoxy-glucuronate N-acetyltransferase
VCGVTIGRYAFIGAGAVVTRDVPDYALIYGNPAKQRGWVCACGVKLSFGNGAGLETQSCKECGLAYRRDDSGVARVESNSSSA